MMQYECRLQAGQDKVSSKEPEVFTSEAQLEPGDHSPPDLFV